MERQEAYNQGAPLEGVHDGLTTLNWSPQHGIHEIVEKVTNCLVGEENARLIPIEQLWRNELDKKRKIVKPHLMKIE